MTAAGYLDDAVLALDATFGVGYAKASPALVAGFINAAALDCGAAVIARALDRAANALEHASD